MREGWRLCGTFQSVKWQGKRRKKEIKKKKEMVRVWKKKKEGKKEGNMDKTKNKIRET